MCEVYLGHLGGLTMKKNVEFYVIGKYDCVIMMYL